MNPDCPECSNEKNPSVLRNQVVAHGHFQRQCDGLRIQRFRCRCCGKSFSTATADPCYRQKKRHLNQQVFEQMASCLTQRRCAYLLRINRKTVVRKFIFMGKAALSRLPSLNESRPLIQSLEFDDLITSEHTKCKPVAVTIVVETGTRHIVGFRSGTIPANGKLAKTSLERYGPRKDERWEMRDQLFQEIKPFVAQGAVIKSDQHPHYPIAVKKHFPNSPHETYKGRRGCVTGQGELKEGGFDPLFSLNHTYAMFRANLSRLVRRTWCTTKKIERLNYHLAIYAAFHNLVLLNQ